jgi:hypothetical protein
MPALCRCDASITKRPAGMVIPAGLFAGSLLHTSRRGHVRAFLTVLNLAFALVPTA